MSEHETVIFGMMIFAAVMFLISRIGNKKQLPNKPEPLNGKLPEISGQFDSNTLQIARAMVGELEKFPDSTNRTLALAEMLHRQKQYEYRQQNPAQAKNDPLETALHILERINGRPYPQNGYRDFRAIPESDLQFRNGRWQ